VGLGQNHQICHRWQLVSLSPAYGTQIQVVVPLFIADVIAGPKNCQQGSAGVRGRASSPEKRRPGGTAGTTERDGRTVVSTAVSTDASRDRLISLIGVRWRTQGGRVGIQSGNIERRFLQLAQDTGVGAAQGVLTRINISNQPINALAAPYSPP
jgi:hypothetical protein